MTCGLLMARLSRKNSVRLRGDFHALTALLLAVLVHGSAAAEVIHYKRLKSFGDIANDGAQPQASLREGNDGALYGTTFAGGSSSNGVVFKLNKDGSGYAVLHHFGNTATDGAKPAAGLLEGSDGFLYGTTYGGGSSGLGTIFKIRGDGSDYAVVRSFTATGSDGSNPEAALIESSDGVLYGTTASGGGSGYSGTAFAIDRDGSNYRLLHRFGPGTSLDGLHPAAPFLEASDGVLYGTTVTGGGEAVGSVFKLNKDGSGYRKLHTFGFNTTAVNPRGGLIEGRDGALYGIAFGGHGGVFKLNKDGSGYQVLRSFGGALPSGALAKGGDDALYGTTFRGTTPFGQSGGNVFRLNEDGSDYRVVHGFGGSDSDGKNPSAGLTLASDGAFYGTTSAGGVLDRGTIFRLLVNRIPVALCADVVVSAGNNCTASVSVDNGSFDPDGDRITLRQMPPGPYPLGTNQVTLIVTDDHGDSNSCNAFVIVRDTTPPVPACPSNQIVEFGSEAGAVVTFSVIATDNCDPHPAINCAPPSGSLFPMGTTEVQCVVSDASGNFASCSFTFTVLGARGLKQEVLAEMTALRATIECGDNPGHHDNGTPNGGKPGNDVCRLLDDAIQHLRASLDSALWLDEVHLDREKGDLVFREERNTVEKLCALLKRRKNEVSDSVLQEFIDRIFRADRLLASTAIQEAISAGVPLRRIELASRFLAKGDADTGDDKCANGIEDYRQAWRHAARLKVVAPARPVNGRMQLRFQCGPGERITIQASSDLLTWETIGTATANLDGIATFEDSNAGSHSARYYRGVSQ